MDSLTRDERSALMRKVRGTNTRPELAVRKIAHAIGYRFRLHRRDLPGTPDLAFIALRKVVFVHGCFWHRHGSRCALTRMPKSRKRFWEAKFTANKMRDVRNRRKLRALGWKYLVVWECPLGDKERLRNKILGFLGDN
jgi:DNA mismatch endonuclease, patch repair protein